MKKLSYRDEQVKVQEGSIYKNNSCTRTIIKGWAWCIFDGFEQWISDDRTFATEQEAYEAAKAAIERWEEKDGKSVKEMDAHNRFMQKTWRSKEAARKGGCKSPIEYECHECGCHFWAEWRSGYTAVPYCPQCDTEDREMIYAL